MTSQTPAIAIPLPHHPSGQRRRLIGLAGILTVAAAVAVAGGLWQAGRSGSETAPPPTVAVEQAAVSRPAESTLTYYLVSSPAEADVLRAIVAQLGTPPLPDVVTLATTADADTFVRMMGEQDAVRDQLGLAPVRVVDLRPVGETAARVPAMDPATFSDQEMHARWLQAQAEVVAASHPDGS